MADDKQYDLVAAPTSPPASPKYAPLTSASLFPPPPSCHVLFTPLNQHFYNLIKQHWPDEGSAQSRDLLSDNTAASNLDVSSSSSSGLGWNRRLLLQRSILLRHASALNQIPDGVKDLTPDLKTDDDVANAIRDINAVDLQLEMDPPDLAVITQQAKGYHLFGQWWPIPAVVTGIEEAGIKRLYEDSITSEGSIDYRPALQLLLRSLVTSYLKLLSLLQFPPSYYALSTMHAVMENQNQEQGTDINGNATTQEEVTWLTTSSSEWNHLRTIALNIQEALNKSRKDQAKRNLEEVMLAQIEDKKRQIRNLKEMMDRVKGTIRTLRGQVSEEGQQSATVKKPKVEVVDVRPSTRLAVDMETDA